MAKVDLKRVEEYIKLGWTKEEALDMAKAEAEEESAAINDFNNQTNNQTNNQSTQKEEPITKADIAQMVADAVAQTQTTQNVEKQTMSDVLGKLV